VTDTRTRTARLLIAAAATATASFALSSPAAAQSGSQRGGQNGARSGQPAAQTADQSSEQVLRDFIHFIFVARYDVAAGLGEELLARGLDPIEFVRLIEGSGQAERFGRAVAEAQRIRGLEEIASELSQMYRAGKLAMARDPEEIARNIALLTDGPLLGRQLARERLAAAGEYAMPQLLQAFLGRENAARRAAVQQVLISMGRHAVVPLSVALPGLPEADQEQVLNVLARIEYPASIPYIAELRQRTGSASVRRAAEQALSSLGAPDAPVPALYGRLAEEYYAEPLHLTSFPQDEYQLLWTFDAGGASPLQMTPVLTEVYHEAMSMRLAERALGLDPQNPETIALWIAGNFSREIDSPEGYDNPAYPADRRDANYFATAAGTDISQRVLRRGLDTQDTPLVRRALAAIEPTAGASALLQRDADGRQPLVEALAYPDRRVQYESALAIGRSEPGEAFEGAERVVPLLAGAIRDAGSRYAVVLTADREEYTRLQTLLEAQGYTVLPPANRGLADLAGPIAQAPGIDLVVTSLSGARTRETVEQVRADPRLRVAPVLALVEPADQAEIQRVYGRDRTVAVRRPAIAEDQLAAAVAEVVERAAGGAISEEEAQQYADRALDVLRDLALSGASVLDVSDAAQQLIAALDDRTGETRLRVADVLARIGQPRAQQAIAEAAIRAAGEERLALLEKVADSAKRFGNQLQSRQVTRLVELAEAQDLATATAAAAALGALGLPNERIVPLILSGREAAPARVSRD